ncbi:MAG: DNA internalization-related competence protein ComEC/Rec2 [Eubacteriales bacterium]|nr:DNA internalization-related competence protein ComEC/Rec2 [Eubacteriales bacterium]
MRRPVVFLFLSFAFGIAMQHHIVQDGFFLILYAFLLTAAYFTARLLKFKNKQTSIVILFLLVTLLGCLTYYIAENRQDPLEEAIGQRCCVEGRVIKIQIKEDYWQMLITSENGGKRLVQVKGNWVKPQDMIGKWARVKGEVLLPNERRNPGLFDYRLYLKTTGVRVILKADSENIALSRENQSILFSKIALIKYSFLDRLEKVMEPEAFGIMTGMLFGDCSLIDDDTYEMFQRNGIAHILSVSGIHVCIVFMFISRLLGDKKTRSFYLLTVLFLILYAALAEFSPSVVRAVVMILIYIISKISYHRYDFMSCTASCAFVMLISNPFYLFHAGFQLSYLAVFCLAAALPWVNRKLDILKQKRKSELVIEGFRYIAPLIVIQIGMAPMTAYMFNYFSIASFFMNIPVIAISGILIPLGIALMPLSFFEGVGPIGLIFEVLAKLAELLINGMIWLNELFYLPGLGFFNVTSPYIFIMLLFYGFFFYLPSELFRIQYQRRKYKVIVGICAVILCVSCLASAAIGTEHHKAGLVFVDVGQGDCLHIRTPAGKNILIDGGGSSNYSVGEKILLPYLLKNQVKYIDLAVVTHLHDDHYLGIVELAKKMKIQKLGIYEANRLQEQMIMADTGLRKQNLLYLAKGDRIEVEKGIYLDVLYPEKQSDETYRTFLMDEHDENESSLLIKLDYHGLTVLLTGDIGLEGEQKIMNVYRERESVLNVDILKVAHHGSRYSTGDRFLDIASPNIAVFQVGKNNFGHPHPTIIDKCLEKDIIVYRNDQDGAVILNEKGEKWQIEALIEGSMHTRE